MHLSSPGYPFRRTDLAEVVRDSFREMEAAIEKSGARVEVGELPLLEADPAQIGILIKTSL